MKRQNKKSSSDSLLQSNPYLLHPSVRSAMLEKNVLESSLLEGARGLKVRAKSKSGVKLSGKHVANNEH